jgi:hypothetical protein
MMSKNVFEAMYTGFFPGTKGDSVSDAYRLPKLNDLRTVSAGVMGNYCTYFQSRMVIFMTIYYAVCVCLTLYR